MCYTRLLLAGCELSSTDTGPKLFGVLIQFNVLLLVVFVVLLTDT